MRTDWISKPIGDVCDIIGGGTPSKRNPDFYNGRIPWATVRDMHSEVLSETEFRITDEAVSKSSTNVIPANNVVIATRVGLGKACLLAQKTAINQDLRALIPKTDNIDPRFLLRWLQSIESQIKSEGTGATVKGVKIAFIRSLRFPFPPLFEQKRIVAILDEAFAGIDTAIANTEKNIDSIGALFASYQESVVRAFITTSSEVALSTHARFIDYRGRTPRKTTSGLRLITAKNVRMGFLQRTPEEFVDPETYDTWMRRGIPDPGDVLFTTEAPLGFVCQLDTNDKVVLAQRIITIQPDRNTLDPAYLKYALMSPPIQKRIHEQATGATAKGIKSSLLKQIFIPFPRIAEQRAVAEKLKQIERECYQLSSLYEKKKLRLLELKESLLQKAFTGELTAEKMETEAREATA